MLPSFSNSSEKLNPLLESLAERIRSQMSQLPQLSLLKTGSEWESIVGVFEGESLLITNELHRCTGMRKLHLEIAQIGRRLQILHCVFFPEPTFDLPIFGVDVVAGPGGVSAAIVDLSPVGSDLPRQIRLGLEELAIPSFSQERELPVWGSIFSQYVRFIRPIGIEEESSFLDLVDDYLLILRRAVDTVQEDSLDSSFTIKRYQGQRFYCLQQKRNDKTRLVLQKAFNPLWAERYIEKILFDEPPPL